MISLSTFAQNQQSEELNPTEKLDVGIPQRPGATQPESGEEGVIGLPYSQMLQDTEPPYDRMFRDVRIGGGLEERLGPADLFMSTRLMRGPRFNAPLFSRGVRPEDAEIKLGRFYLDFRAVSGGLIYSDNVTLREDDPRSGVIGILRLTMAASLQITERLRIATYGTLVYLPFQNKIGIAGFGFRDPFARFEAAPSWRTQLTFDWKAGHWEFEAIDDFRVRQRRFGALGSFDLFDGERFDEEDRAGRFVFGDRTRTGSARQSNARFEEFYEARNLVGAVAHRLLPTETRLTIGAFHSDMWYFSSSANDLPHSRDSAYVSLDSERESLRFKPFARYRVSRRDSEDWDQEAHVGFRGPITENLRLLASGGYFNGGQSEKETYLARARLRHTPGPYTFHQLEFHRGITEPEGGLETSWYYLLRQVLGPDLYGEVFAFKADFDNLRRARAKGEEWRAGVRVTYNLGKHTTLRTSATYAKFDYEGSRALGDYDAWIGRAELFYRFTHSFHGRLVYQYQTRDSTRIGESYDENFVGVHFIKYL
jgi:hypothetical protein